MAHRGDVVEGPCCWESAVVKEIFVEFETGIVYRVTLLGSSSFIAITTGGGDIVGLVRTGIEAGKLRMGVEYNIIPASEYGGTTNNTIRNSYWGVAFGFLLGTGQQAKNYVVK